MRNPLAVFLSFFVPVCFSVDITGSTIGEVKSIRAAVPSFKPLAEFPADIFRSFANMLFLGAMAAIPDSICSFVLLGGAISVECFKVLGKGSFGTVYQAIAKAPGMFGTQDVAVKVSNIMIQGMLDTAFAREVQVLKSVKHPNIVKMVASASDASYNYLLLELLSGGSLQGLISDDTRVPVSCALFLIRQLIEAVATLHEAGYAHKDIKPGNIMLRSAWPGAGLVLCDFGIARHIKKEGHSSCGTPGWMAPEVYARKGGFAADWYAVGLVFFSLLTGETLSSIYGDNKKLLEGMRNKTILRELFGHAAWTRRGIPKQVERFIVSLLAHDPYERPSANDIKHKIWGLCEAFPYDFKNPDPAAFCKEDDLAGWLDLIMKREPPASVEDNFASAVTGFTPFGTALGALSASSASTFATANGASVPLETAFTTAPNSSASVNQADNVNRAVASPTSDVLSTAATAGSAATAATAATAGSTATAGPAVTDVVPVSGRIRVRVGRLKLWRRKVKDKIKRKLGTG